MVVHLQVKNGFTIQYNLQCTSPLHYGHKSMTNIQEFYAGCEENATKTESQNQLPAHSFTENNKLHSLPLTTAINSLHCKPFLFTYTRSNSSPELPAWISTHTTFTHSKRYRTVLGLEDSGIPHQWSSAVKLGEHSVVHCAAHRLPACHPPLNSLWISC